MERIDDVEMIGRVGGIKPNPLGEKLKAVADAIMKILENENN